MLNKTSSQGLSIYLLLRKINKTATRMEHLHSIGWCAVVHTTPVLYPRPTGSSPLTGAKERPGVYFVPGVCFRANRPRGICSVLCSFFIFSARGRLLPGAFHSRLATTGLPGADKGTAGILVGFLPLNAVMPPPGIQLMLWQ